MNLTPPTTDPAYHCFQSSTESSKKWCILAWNHFLKNLEFFMIHNMVFVNSGPLNMLFWKQIFCFRKNKIRGNKFFGNKFFAKSHCSPRKAVVYCEQWYKISCNHVIFFHADQYVATCPLIKAEVSQQVSVKWYLYKRSLLSVIVMTSLWMGDVSI